MAGLGHDALEHNLSIEKMEKFNSDVLQKLARNVLRKAKGAMLTKLLGDIWMKLAGLFRTKSGDILKVSFRDEVLEQPTNEMHLEVKRVCWG